MNKKPENSWKNEADGAAREGTRGPWEETQELQTAHLPIQAPIGAAV